MGDVGAVALGTTPGRVLRHRSGRALRLSSSLAVLALAGTSTGSAPISAQEAHLDGVAYEVGAVGAPVTVVEYADFACTACREFALETWPSVLRDFVDAGRVRWRFVPFELGFRNSDESVRMGHCGAELGDFWAMHDALYESQPQWLNERRPKAILIAAAVGMGHDPVLAESCYDDDPGQERTKAANRAARSDGVRATPTFFINGFRIQGALPLETFRELIEAAEKGRLGGR